MKNRFIVLKIVLIFPFYIYSLDKIIEKEYFRNNAQEWVKENVIDNNLESTSVNILTNYLSISFQLSGHDCQISNYSRELLKLCWAIRKGDLNYKLDIENNLRSICIICKNINELILKRNFFYDSYKNILSLIEKMDDSNFKKIIGDLEKNIQVQVNEALLNKKIKLEEKINLIKEDLSKSNEVLRLLVGTYQSIIDGTFPFKSQEGFELIFKINDTLNIARLSTQNSWDALIANDPLFDLYSLVNNLTKTAIEEYYLALMHKE